MQRKKTTAVALLFYLFAIMPLFAVDIENSPGWLVFEKGKQLFEAEELGEAVYHFRRARELLGSSPEVDFWIGRVFEAEGEYLLASRQYQAALGQRRLLLVPDEEISLRRHLAHIYFTFGDFAAYLSQLEEIVRYDTAGRKQHTSYTIEPPAVASALTELGYDKLLELYRIEDFGGHASYYDLGVYKYRTGLYESGVEYLTFAFVITHTKLINHLIRLDPEYRFTTLPELISDALRHRQLFDYLYSVDAFGQIYTLGTALYQSGGMRNREVAAQLLRIVTEYDIKERWTVKARRQLITPFKDDFMIVFPE